MDKNPWQAIEKSCLHHIRSSCSPISPDGSRSFCLFWFSAFGAFGLGLLNMGLSDYIGFCCRMTTEICFENMTHLSERLTGKNITNRSAGAFF
jgi:hypothetical protein